MSTFVLIPGAWLGPWVWEPIVRYLRERGHVVHTVALTGLDDPDADVSSIHLETHIDDVLSVLYRHDLRDVVLVGHDVSGVLAGVVADRCERVRHTVYVEGFVAADGRSVLEAFPPRIQAEELRVIATHGGRWPVPDQEIVEEGQDLSEGQAADLIRRMVPHPGGPLCTPVTLKHPVAEQRSTYIVCARDHFGDLMGEELLALRSAPAWTFHTLATGLWPMVSAPRSLSELLSGID